MQVTESLGDIQLCAELVVSPPLKHKVAPLQLECDQSADVMYTAEQVLYIAFQQPVFEDIGIILKLKC